MTNLDRFAIGEMLELAGDPERFAQFERDGKSCGWCSEPIRLRGTSRIVDPATGEITTTDLGEYAKACGTRRSTRCPSCAHRYRNDARAIVGAGLRGGKGIPESIATHPAVFATFTAPSFGRVHRSTRSGDQCRKGRAQHCPHGKSTVCSERHGVTDARVGNPLCPDCYDYERAVLWNALAPELWRRTTIYLRRALARSLEIKERDLRAVLRLSFAKVVEYQRRGAIHIHAIIRIDDIDDSGASERIGLAGLIEAVEDVASAVAVGYPEGIDGAARFGAELKVDPLGAGSGRLRRRIAGYVAKYATKSTDDAGGLDRRLRSIRDLEKRTITPHLRRLAEVAWKLGNRPSCTELGLRRFAHALGFRGHWLTKSRQWSTTFKALREERQEWRDAKEEKEPTISTVAIWSYRSRGWATDGEEVIAAVRQKNADFARSVQRESTFKEVGVAT